MSDLPVLDCADCGACCLHVGHPPFLRFARGDRADPYWAALPPELQREVSDHIDNLQDHDMGQPCIWLDLQTRRCRHYEHRPQQCRDFEVGNYHCLRLRATIGLDRGAGPDSHGIPADG